MNESAIFLKGTVIQALVSFLDHLINFLVELSDVHINLVDVAFSLENTRQLFNAYFVRKEILKVLATDAIFHHAHYILKRLLLVEMRLNISYSPADIRNIGLELNASKDVMSISFLVQLSLKISDSVAL